MLTMIDVAQAGSASDPWAHNASVSSPLWICDRLIALAEEAEKAGYAEAADALVRLAVGLPEARQAPVQTRRSRLRLS